MIIEKLVTNGDNDRVFYSNYSETSGYRIKTFTYPATHFLKTAHIFQAKVMHGRGSYFFQGVCLNNAIIIGNLNFHFVIRIFLKESTLRVQS